MSHPNREQLQAEFYEFVESALTCDLGRKPTFKEIEDAMDEGDWRTGEK